MMRFGIDGRMRPFFSDPAANLELPPMRLSLRNIWPISLLVGVAAFGIVAKLGAQQPPIRFNQPRNIPEFRTLFMLEAAKPADGDDERTRLLKQRFNVAYTETALRHENYRHNLDAHDELFDAVERLHHAGADLNAAGKPLGDFLEKLLGYTRQLERYFEPFSQIDNDSAGDMEALRYHRLTIELGLLQNRERGKAKP